MGGVSFAEYPESAVELYVVIESKLGSREQADRHVGLTDFGKTPRDRYREIRGNEPVRDLGWPRGDEMQTVVAHRNALLSGTDGLPTVGDDHSADAVAFQPGAGALPVASSPSNKSLTVVNEDFGDQAAHEGRDQADRGEYRQTAGAIEPPSDVGSALIQMTMPKIRWRVSAH
jgi:hypothetical protein